MSPTGRFAPSPTSDLHLGNLRTAVVAWLLSRHAGGRHLLRVEDLDQVRVAAAGDVAARQLADLAELGLDHDGEVWWQSRRLDAYAEALSRLEVYECFCTRKEIAEASQAPHDPSGYRPYPGTCRDLPPAERARRRASRQPALRVRAEGAVVTIHDRWHGDVTATVDDFVVRRNDADYAYNLAAVVDDGLSGVTQVCRGDDLLTSAPRQAWLAARLGFEPPTYAHVGLVSNSAGQRLAKRDGDVTRADLHAAGWSDERIVGWIGHSLGLCAEGTETTTRALLESFDPDSARVGAVVWG